MACRLFGAKPLSEPVLGHCQLDPQEQTSLKFWSKVTTCHPGKCVWKYRLRTGGHFLQVCVCVWVGGWSGGDELTYLFSSFALSVLSGSVCIVYTSAIECTVVTKKYACVSPFVYFFGLILVIFTHKRRGYFSGYGTRMHNHMRLASSTNEEILTNMYR